MSQLYTCCLTQRKDTEPSIFGSTGINDTLTVGAQQVACGAHACNMSHSIAITYGDTVGLYFCLFLKSIFISLYV